MRNSRYTLQDSIVYISIYMMKGRPPFYTMSKYIMQESIKAIHTNGQYVKNTLQVVHEIFNLGQ